METVSIRNLRGASLRERARRGRPLAITNHRVLIGVFIPVAAAWVEHLIEYKWSHVLQTIAEGEQAIASSTPLATLDDLIAERDSAESHPGQHVLEPSAIPLLASIAGGTVAQAPQTRQVVERLRAAFNPTARLETGPAEESVRTVRIGDLKAELIEQAGLAHQTLAVTHARELIGIVIPVTPDLVGFLIEQNVSRVLYNIGLSEKQLSADDGLTTLDELLDHESSGASSD